MQLKEIKNIFHLELDKIYPKEEVVSFFHLMIEHYLGLQKFTLVLEPNYTITKEEEQPFFEGLQKLKEEFPIQYILGTAHFMDLDFKVDKNVLIPRPETEELVRWILAEIENKKSEINILDIGTGSGCIAISLAKQLPNAKVYALDVSKDALAVAKENARNNNVSVEFLRANILTNPNLEQKFDIIVSNPPYVRELEKAEMQNNVLEHEPDLALFVADDNNPLVFYSAITEFAVNHLKPNGKLFFEINQYLGKETKIILENHNFNAIELKQDMFTNDRMLKGNFS